MVAISLLIPIHFLLSYKEIYMEYWNISAESMNHFQESTISLLEYSNSWYF